jgi:hypothetical protein
MQRAIALFVIWGKRAIALWEKRALFLSTQNKETGFLHNLRATARYFHKNPVSGHLSIRLL